MPNTSPTAASMAVSSKVLTGALSLFAVPRAVPAVQVQLTSDAAWSYSDAAAGIGMPVAANTIATLPVNAPLYVTGTSTLYAIWLSQREPVNPSAVVNFGSPMFSGLIPILF